MSANDEWFTSGRNLTVCVYRVSSVLSVVASLCPGMRASLKAAVTSASVGSFGDSKEFLRPSEMMKAAGSACGGTVRRPFFRRIRVSSILDAWARASFWLLVPSERLNDRPEYRKRT